MVNEAHTKRKYNIKAIFFDIDGTLVSDQYHIIPNSTIETLKKLKDKGIKLFIATGRAPDALHIVKDLDIDGYITMNGQYCYDDEVVYENMVPKEDLLTILNEIKNNPFPCGFMSKDTKRFNYLSDEVIFIMEHTQVKSYEVGDLNEWLDKKIHQVIPFIDEEREKDLASKLKYSHTARWHKYFTDVSPIGGSKAKGIDVFLDKYHIGLDECMVFGDGGNDVNMLEHVPISIAMGNGSDKCKEVAFFTTKSVDEDGILYACKYFGLI